MELNSLRDPFVVSETQVRTYPSSLQSFASKTAWRCGSGRRGGGAKTESPVSLETTFPELRSSPSLIGAGRERGGAPLSSRVHWRERIDVTPDAAAPTLRVSVRAPAAGAEVVPERSRQRGPRGGLGPGSLRASGPGPELPCASEPPSWICSCTARIIYR